MELLSVVIGFVLGLIGTAFGTVLHMRYLDRKLVPPQPRPLPAPRPLRPQQGGPHDLI